MQRTISRFQIKVASIDEGFEFSSYICSLMIPVSIILREVSSLTSCFNH